VTAVALDHYCDHKFPFLYDPCKDHEGIPFYLPKPLLIVAKNFRNIEETKVGLTDSAPIPNFFDDQAKYADLNARTNFSGLDANAASGTPAATSGPEQFPTGDAKNLASVSSGRVYSSSGAPVSPGVVASDGLKPETFYTCHIVFVPDLTQKYGLRIKGGAGEIRAAMNLVNGWQFTGLGPYYMKDSSTAQNTLAAGITANLAASGVSDVVKAVAGLKPGAQLGTGAKTSGVPPQPLAVDAEKVRAVADALRHLQPKFVKIPAFAEISIYDAYISPEGTMEWKLVAEKSFERNVMATEFQPQDVLRLLQSATVTPAVNTGPSISVPPRLEGADTKPATPAPPKPGVSPPLAPGAASKPPTDGAANPPKNRAVEPGGDCAPATDLSPLAPAPSALVIPPPRGQHVTLLKGTALRRSSIRTIRQEGPEGDTKIIRTRLPETAALNQDTVASALAQSQGVSSGLLRLSRAVSGTITDQVTSNNFPVIEVTAAPANATLRLLRDNVIVNSIATGGTVGTVSIPDNGSGAVSVGSYKYEVDLVMSSGKVIPIGQLPVQIVPPETPPVAVPTAVAAPALQNELLRQMFARTGALPGFPAPASTLSGGPVVTGIPAAVPSNGNQINLNQYFGRTKMADPAAPTASWFSWFHPKHKERPKEQTFSLSGVNVEAPASALPATVGAPPTLGGAATPPPTASSVAIPGTGPPPLGPAPGTTPSVKP
jgi:hypothetical protein